MMEEAQIIEMHECHGCEEVKLGDVFLNVSVVDKEEHRQGEPVFVMKAEGLRFHMSAEAFELFRVGVPKLP